MGFEILKESYTGDIRNISIGAGEKAVTVGGETCYPFYQFEGDMPNKPRIAMEVWDLEPDDWPESALVHFKDVVSDPAAWAKKCVDKYGAEMIALQLKSTDPNGRNANPEEATATVKKVLEAIDVPLIVWGTSNFQKDEEVFKKVAEACQDATLTIGPVEDKNHKGIGASAMGFGHTVIASSPIDVNLAKQVNILLENLGVPTDRMIIDPTTGGLGYGLEYSYSVMERIRMAALTQGDDKLQLPIINNLGNEVWKCKEAKLSVDEAPALGDPEKRGVLMEAIGAVSYLMAGSDVLIMRHPEAIRLTKSFIDMCSEGGTADAVAPIKKELPQVAIDYASISPEPDLTIEEEKPKKPVPAKKVEAPKSAEKPEAVKAAAPEEAKVVAPEPEPKKKEVKPEEPVEDAEAKAKAELEARLKAEAEAKAKAELEAKLKAEAEEKAEAEAKAKEAAEAKAREEAETKAVADAKAKIEAEEEAIRQQRAKELAERAAMRKAASKAAVSMTPADVQKSPLDKMVEQLNSIHRRVA